VSGGPSPHFVVQQEEDAVRARPILAAAVASVVIGAIGVFFSAIILARVAGALQPNAAGRNGPAPGVRTIAHLEQTPLRDTRFGIDLRSSQRRELDRWGWVDRGRGVATIPIDRAIDVVVAEEAR
jgi:hypothetical protein